MCPICLFPFLSFQCLQMITPFPSLQFLLQGDVVFPFLLIATIPINLGYILLKIAENSNLNRFYSGYCPGLSAYINPHHFT